LYRHVLHQADRSSNADWARRVRESAHPVRCTLCEGTGLRQFARLLRVGEKSFADWTLMSAGEMLRVLRSVQPKTPRQKRGIERILYCLEPLTSRASIPGAIIRRSVETFTTMAVIESDTSDGS
jgi:excinuclease UvrABC ATPase subunit